LTAVYIDTSALGRVLLDEPSRPAIQRTLDGFERVTASHLLRVELRRLGLRRGLLDRANTVLADVSLVPIDREILSAAETLLPDVLGTLDAIHLATALRLVEAAKLGTLMTYDKQLAKAAREHDIDVLSPS
jgi:predicted nucleic acid-binding protein